MNEQKKNILIFFRLTIGFHIRKVHVLQMEIEIEKW